jgi:ABC-2 type transport system ATP-binding protein
MRMILGLLRPTSGSIALFGHPADPRRPRDRRGIGALVEGPAFYDRLSGYGNLLLLGRLSAPVTRSQARELLEAVGLADAADRPVRNYSLGMKQRLGIALALVAEPRLVVLDEPFNGLDPQGMHDMRSLVATLNRERGMTFVISSHLLHEVEHMSNRVGIMHRGEMVAERPVSALLAESGGEVRIQVDHPDEAEKILAAAGLPVPRRLASGAILVEADPARVPQINRRLVEAGLAVSAIVPERASLEDLFLKRTEGSTEVRP